MQDLGSVPRARSSSIALRSISSSRSLVQIMASVIAAGEASRGLRSSMRVFHWLNS
jgi:hypothetical protein